jgi:spore germination cell wall hydrolase CwlJ-like protein
LVVSITAEAGQDPAVIKGAAFENAQTSARRALSSGAFLLSDGALDAAAGKPRLIEASLTLGNPDDLGGIDDEIDPRADLKRTRLPMPVVDRSRKGNPFIGLRPGFDAKLHRPKASAAAGDGRPSFIDPFGSVESALAYAELPPDTEATPWSDPDSAPTKSLTFDDGATPSVPLDVALNSATPAPSDDKPIAVAAKPEIPGVSDIAKTMANGQPDYASLIDPKDSTRQQRCLAEAVYFEARSEPEDGQAAVAQVVLNRVRSGLYPANVCGVVYQDRNRPFACQFSFACEGKSLRVEEPGPWSVAVRIAQDVTEGKVYNAKVGAALNYHANYVMPYWASTLKRVDQIGHHIFYQLRISQN